MDTNLKLRDINKDSEQKARVHRAEFLKQIADKELTNLKSNIF